MELAELCSIIIIPRTRQIEISVATTRYPAHVVQSTGHTDPFRVPILEADSNRDPAETFECGDPANAATRESRGKSWLSDGSNLPFAVGHVRSV